MILPEDRSKVLKAINKAIEYTQSYEVEYRIKHKGGGIRYVIERGRPIKGADEKLLYIDGVIFDITERKNMEEEISKAQKLESIGILAGGIAHDVSRN